MDELIDQDQIIDGPDALFWNRCNQRFQQGPWFRGGQVGCQVVAKSFVVLEGERLGIRFQEKIKGVINRHLGHQVDCDFKVFGFLRKHQSRQIIGEWVLLPIEKMTQWLNSQRVRQDRRLTVRRWSETNNVSAQIDRSIVVVNGTVMKCYLNGHEVAMQLICQIYFQNKSFPARSTTNRTSMVRLNRETNVHSHDLRLPTRLKNAHFGTKRLE